MVEHNPSLIRYILFSNVAFGDDISMRLGLSIFDRIGICSFCHQEVDDFGHHAMNCMATGQKQTLHSTINHAVYRMASHAAARPILEPTGLLPDAPHLRPADVLLMTPFGKRTRRRRFPRLALDFAITSPFVRRPWQRRLRLLWRRHLHMRNANDKRIR